MGGSRGVTARRRRREAGRVRCVRRRAVRECGHRTVQDTCSFMSVARAQCLGCAAGHRGRPPASLPLLLTVLTKSAFARPHPCRSARFLGRWLNAYIWRSSGAAGGNEPAWWRCYSSVLLIASAKLNFTCGLFRRKRPRAVPAHCRFQSGPREAFSHATLRKRNPFCARISHSQKPRRLCSRCRHTSTARVTGLHQISTRDRFQTDSRHGHACGKQQPKAAKTTLQCCALRPAATRRRRRASRIRCCAAPRAEHSARHRAWQSSAPAPAASTPPNIC